MSQRFLPLGIVLWMALPSALHAAPLHLLEEGFAQRVVSHNCTGGMDFLPSGDLACSDGLRVVVLDSNGDGIPQIEQVLFQFPMGSVFGSFVKRSPSGQALLIGESSHGALYHVQVATGESTFIATLPFNFSATFLSEDEVLISASPEGTATKLYYLQLSTQRLQVIADLSGPSGPVALDDAKNLYYIRSTYEFPAPPGSHTLLRFSNAMFMAALRNEQRLVESDARVLATLDSGFSIILNSFGDCFVSDFSGNVQRITPTGAVSTFAQVEGGVGLVTAAAFDQEHHPFQPYEPSGARAAFLVDDFSPTKQIAIIEPQQDDPFGDTVISYEPGPGQFVNNPNFNNPQRALGAPVGGGTVNGDTTSQVTLGNGGTLTLKTLAPIIDDAHNRYGLDFLVFGNAFFVNANPLVRTAEPAFVEVSQDLNHNSLPDDAWFLILPDPLPVALGQLSPTQYRTLALRHYADATPTLKRGDMNGDNETNGPVDQPTISPAIFYTTPDRLPRMGDAASFAIDNGSGGGDGFDLREAVIETAPGVPQITPAGDVQRVYLDRVNFVRLTDAVPNDVIAPTGEVSAEIDAISDVRVQVPGRRIYVDGRFAGVANGSSEAPYNDLHTAMSQAVAGDEIAVRPGVYPLQRPLMITPGVSLVGSAGLWTPNLPQDDTVLDASMIQYAPGEVEAALIIRASSSPATQVGEEISGFHITSCRTGLLVEGRAPTIQENVFTDCFTAIDIRGGSDTVVIRKNLLGDRRVGQPATGLRCEGRSVALTHNVFVHHDQEAILARDGCQLYLRDNIFDTNYRPIHQMGSGSLFGHFNVIFGHTAPSILLSGTLEQNILQDPTFAFPEVGDYRLRADSPVRGQGMGGADPGLYDGRRFIPFDIVLDTLAPSSPTGLAAQRSGNTVTVTWVRSTERDVVGYHLYRSQALNEGFTVLGGVIPVETMTATDSESDPTVTWYYAVSAIDQSGNESPRSVPVAVGPAAPFILSLDVPHLSNVQSEDLSGAVTAKMILDYLGSVQSVPVLQAAGLAMNSPEHQNQSFLDPQGLRGILNRFHPPKYNFSVRAQATAEQLLRDMSFWVSFSIPGVTPAHVPGAFPAFGDYQQWMLVTGIATSDNPQHSHEYTVLGMWLHDPHVEGLGAHSFKTAEELKQTYLLPVTQQDSYQGRFVSILEPPVNDAIVHVARSKPRLRHRGVPRSAQTRDTTDSIQLSLDQQGLVQRAAVEALREEVGVHDTRVQQLLGTLTAQTPLLIQDTQEPYYLVPLGRGQRAQAAVILCATDGHFKEASWSEAPQLYLPISQDKALTAVKARLLRRNTERATDQKMIEPQIRHGAQALRHSTAQLIHIPGTNPYYPTWEIRVVGLVFRVDQKGVVRILRKRPTKVHRQAR